MKLKVFIVEDSKLAMSRLIRLLDKYENIEVAGTANNGQKALTEIKSSMPDLLFLDVELGNMNSFELISELDYEPYIIFTTGYKKYAFKAFEIESIDYILKPITKERLDKSLNKLNRIINKREIEKKKPDLKNIITIKTPRGYKIIEKKNIIYFESDKNIVFVHTNHRKHLYHKTLLELEKEYKNQQFVRIHNRFIVNIEFISAIKKRNSVDYKCILKDDNNTELNIGRVYIKKLKKILGVNN